MVVHLGADSITFRVRDTARLAWSGSALGLLARARRRVRVPDARRVAVHPARLGAVDDLPATAHARREVLVVGTSRGSFVVACEAVGGAVAPRVVCLGLASLGTQRHHSLAAQLAARSRRDRRVLRAKTQRLVVLAGRRARATLGAALRLAGTSFERSVHVTRFHAPERDERVAVLRTHLVARKGRPAAIPTHPHGLLVEAGLRRRTARIADFEPEWRLFGSLARQTCGRDDEQPPHAGSMDELLRVVCIVVAFLTSAACHDLAEIEYEGEKVRVGTFFGEELCAGDLRWMDEFVRRVEVDLDAADDEPVEIHLFHPNEPRLPNRCESSACYDVKHARIFSPPASLEHEIVHAVNERVGRPADILYREGIANALPNRRQLFGRTFPSDNLDLDHPDLDGRTIGHFMRWLWEEHDRDAFRRLARGELFADAFGFTFEDAEAEFLEEAPWAYPRRWPCSAPPLQAAGEHAWEETLTFACDDDLTMTISAQAPSVDTHTRRTTRTFEVTRAGLYHFTGLHRFDLVKCQLAPVDDAPPETAGPRAAPPDPRALDETLGGAFYGFLGTDHVQAELTAGSYEITVYGFVGDDSAVRVVIEPALVGTRPG
jgi:hypothetical protein